MTVSTIKCITANGMIIYFGAESADYVTLNKLYTYGFGRGEMNSTHIHIWLHCNDVIHSVHKQTYKQLMRNAIPLSSLKI